MFNSLIDGDFLDVFQKFSLENFEKHPAVFFQEHFLSRFCTSPKIPVAFSRLANAIDWEMGKQKMDMLKSRVKQLAEELTVLNSWSKERSKEEQNDLDLSEGEIH